LTTKKEFSDEEWESLMASPWVAGALVIAADFHVHGAIGEVKAMEESTASTDAAGAAEELVRELIAGMEDHDQDEDTSDDSDDEESEGKSELLAMLTSVAEIVDRVCSTDEAAGYKSWVVSVATSTAEASKEGRLLGFGGDRVSAKESASIAEIEQALSL